MSKVKVTWEIEDGYAGKSRPQFTKIDSSEFESCGTMDEMMEIVEVAVQSDYEQLLFAIGDIDWDGVEIPQ